MKYLSLCIVFVMLLMGCDINHNPKGIIQEIEPISHNWHREENQCQYYVTFQSYQSNDYVNESSDVWFVFPCDRYDVGDTLRIEKIMSEEPN